MIRDNYLDINKIVKDKKVYRLFKAVEDHGGVIRFVGGCVRDALRGIEGSDIDLATDLSPEELVEACDESGLKTVAIGIKFGTVGVIINDNLLEVTSLRKDVSTDGRHAVVEFTDNWEVDASRRDLTINAVYADMRGNVFDYYNGVSDLEKGIIRFIGKPNQRIQEDYLRILRFFRFYSIFAKTPIDEKALKACVENCEGLKTLSMERIRDELEKILLTPNVISTVKLMQEKDILSHIMPTIKNFDNLEFLINLVDKEEIPHEVMRRLFVLYSPDATLAENLANRLKMTKKQKQHFVNWAEINPAIEEFLSQESLNKLIYKHGKEFCRDKLLLTSAKDMKEIPNIHEILQYIDGAIVPVFPIRGKDIVEAGVSEHKLIGKIMDSMEEKWIESNFSMTREELLKIACDISHNKNLCA